MIDFAFLTHVFYFFVKDFDTAHKRQILINLKKTSLLLSKQSHDVVMTLFWRLRDVITSHRRQYDVILTSCARWFKFSFLIIQSLLSLDTRFRTKNIRIFVGLCGKDRKGIDTQFSDQPAHLRTLIRVFSVCINDLCTPENGWLTCNFTGVFFNSMSVISGRWADQGGLFCLLIRSMYKGNKTRGP